MSVHYSPEEPTINAMVSRRSIKRVTPAASLPLLHDIPDDAFPGGLSAKDNPALVDPHLLECHSKRLRERRCTRVFSQNSPGWPRAPPPPPSTRNVVWQLLSGSSKKEGSYAQWSKLIERFNALLIIGNVAADILDSVPAFPFTEDTSPDFRHFECFTCAVFTVEYALRLWACVESTTLEGDSHFHKRLRFMRRALPVVDLLVLVIFYIDIFATNIRSKSGDLFDFQVLKVVRMLRLIALFKMERQAGSFSMVFHVFAKKQADLFATLFLATVLLIVASTAMYYVEVRAQPDKFASIPATMWWSVTAMTTVGYGDIFPITVPGKVLGSIVAFLGVGLFALPSGIISSGFVEVLEEQRQVDTDDLAELLDEDKASIDKLHEEVRHLQKTVDKMNSRVIYVDDQFRELRDDQKQVLELLQQVLEWKTSREEASAPPQPHAQPSQPTQPPSQPPQFQPQKPPSPTTPQSLHRMGSNGPFAKDLVKTSLSREGSNKQLPRLATRTPPPARTPPAASR